MRHESTLHGTKMLPATIVKTPRGNHEPRLANLSLRTQTIWGIT